MRFKKLGVFCLSFLVTNLVFCAGTVKEKELMVTEKLGERIRALFIAEGTPLKCYPQLDMLERKTDWRFIFQRTVDPDCRGNSESAQACDGILWDSASFPVILQERTNELQSYLKRDAFDLIVLEGKKLPDRIQQMLVKYVKEGGTLVWMGPTKTSEGIIQELNPFVVPEKMKKINFRKESLQLLKPKNPLVCGIPLEEMNHKLRPKPVHFKIAVDVFVSFKPSGIPFIGCMDVGKGKVIAINNQRMIPSNHTLGKNGTDTDFLWVQFWRQLGQICKRKDNVSPGRILIELDETSFAAGSSVPLSVIIEDCPNTDDLKCKIKLSDQAGTCVCDTDVVFENNSTTAKASLLLPSTLNSGTYRICAKAYKEKWSLFSSEKKIIDQAFAIITVNAPVKVRIETDKSGYEVGETVQLKAVFSSDNPLKAKAILVISDSMGVPVMFSEQDVTLAPQKETQATFNWKMPDYGVEGWAFRADVFLKNAEEKTLAEATKWFWRYQKWSMREKILISNYWDGTSYIPASLMELFAIYHRGIGYSAAHHWHEPYFSRFNMRAWYQWGATRMENYFPRDFDWQKMAQRHVGSYIKRCGNTAAYVIQDFGEETGFGYHWSNNPFGRTFKEDKDIPEKWHKLFQIYLKEKYKTIDKLNNIWQRTFTGFDKIKLSRKYGLPSGWLFVKPPQDLEQNLAPYLDTHGFFFWFCRKVFTNITSEINKTNPTSDWSMSFSLTFNLFSPIPMTMVHPCYNAQILAPWHAKAIARGKDSTTPIFSFHWGFDEDYRIWGQFWNQNLASIATFWCNWGSQFNYDFTHSRSTFLLKKLMTHVRPREKFFLDCYPDINFDVGIYHPDIDWQTVHSRPNFYLKAQGPNDFCMGQLGFKSTGTGWLGGPEFQIYNALSASGYNPRFVAVDEIKRCKTLVVPYVETMPEKAAAEIRDFVAQGGLLITLPVLASHDGYGKPYKTVPGAGLSEVIGLTVSPDIIGQRSITILPRKSSIPLNLTPRMGSEPCYLWSYAHQKVLSMDKNTEVILKLYDGNPAITLHPFGKGKAVHINMFTFDQFLQYESTHFQTESMRQLMDSLARFGGVKPPLFVERPLLYGEGVNEWSQYQYILKDSNIRVLALYSDKASPTISAQVVLSEPVSEVFDILNNEKVPVKFRIGGKVVEELEPFAFTKAKKAGLSTGLTFPVTLNPGDVAFYALVPYKTGTIKMQVAEDTITAGKDPIDISLSLLQKDGQPIPGAHPVQIDVMDSSGKKMPMLCRKVTAKPDTKVSILTRVGDPEGPWQIKATDCLTGQTVVQKVNVNSSPIAKDIPVIKDIFYASANPDKINVSEKEFLALLDSLSTLYLNGRNLDKTALSFYTHEKDLSRHRIMQLLSQVDWRKYVSALEDHIREGNTVVLLGEDMGVDPATGISVEPVYGQKEDTGMDMASGGKLPFIEGPHTQEALRQIAGEDFADKAWPDNRLIIPMGKGYLILDKISFDNMGTLNGQFSLHHARWLKQIEKKIFR